MIKLICCDLDGTLLTNDKKITEYNKEMIHKFISLGGHFVLASGRPIGGVKHLIDELNLYKDNDTTLTYNGGVIALNKTNEILSKNCIKGLLVKELYKESIRLNTNFHFFKDDNTLYTTEFNPYTEIEATINHIEAHLIDINEVRDDDLYIKAMLVSDSQTLDKIRDKIDPKFNNLAITRSSKVFLEFQNKNISKGAGLKFLKEYYNIKDNETMAIGDQENDLSMIKEAYIGVAMANAIDVVKDSANYITLDNEHSGVGYAINELILKGSSN